MENKAINIPDIKKLLDIVSNQLDILENKDVIIFEDDLYWNIIDDELYNPYQEPGKLTMGSITEDCEFLRKVVEDEREIIDYDLYKLASILRFLGKNNIINKK